MICLYRDLADLLDRGRNHDAAVRQLVRGGQCGQFLGGELAGVGEVVIRDDQDVNIGTARDRFTGISKVDARKISNLAGERAWFPVSVGAGFDRLNGNFGLARLFGVSAWNTHIGTRCESRSVSHPDFGPGREVDCATADITKLDRAAGHPALVCKCAGRCEFARVRHGELCRLRGQGDRRARDIAAIS